MLSKWMKENILDKGVENVRFFAEMERIEAILPWANCCIVSNQYSMVECRIDEKIYEVVGGYKITLTPVVEGFAHKHFYQSDFESLVKKGHILIKDKETEHVERIKWFEPLSGSLILVHEADVVVA